MTAAALWLNSFFSGYDMAILSILHSIAAAVGVVLTPLMKLVTLLGEKGIIFFLIALVCMCFSRTRRLGVCIFGAVCCGALITNVILKDAVARPRPFLSDVNQFGQWWMAVGSPKEDGFSFPSGHVTAAAAGMTAISLMKGKRYIVPSVVIVLLMGIARNYLMAHYPSDVLFAVIIGVASGFIAWFITRFIFDLLERHDDNNICALVLDYDVPFTLPTRDDLLALINRGGKSSGRAAPRGGQRPAAETAERGAPSRHSAPERSEAPRSARASTGGHSRGGGAGYRGKHEK